MEVIGSYGSQQLLFSTSSGRQPQKLDHTSKRYSSNKSTTEVSFSADSLISELSSHLKDSASAKKLMDFLQSTKINDEVLVGIVNQLLQQIKTSIEDDQLTSAGLTALASSLQKSSSVSKTCEDDVVSCVVEVLEKLRMRQTNASVQELQRNEWKDGHVYKAARSVLDTIAESNEAILKPARTNLSKAKRLLLFAPADPDNRIHNVKTYISEMAQRDLLAAEEDHPLAMLASIVRSAFPDFNHFGPNVNPVVTTKQCFDDLLVPQDHVSRKPSDTFYLNETTILRAHTSAHQTQFLSKGYTQFLVSGDVYRRDEIDKTHFPVFHQMEGVKVLPPGATEQDAFEDLKLNLNRLADVLFPGMPRKWIDAYFPFTHPSLELEIEFKNKSVELLGCGVVQPKILQMCGLEGRVAWAFGLGLERLAMILFQIPDIRLFWTDDKRFLDQFIGCKTKFLKRNKAIKFKSFSKYPPTKRDISFWLPLGKSEFHINDFYSIVREIAGDNVEEVTLVDEFVGSDGRNSRAFRIIFRSDFKTLSGVEVNAMVENIVARLQSEFKVIVR